MPCWPPAFGAQSPSLGYDRHMAHHYHPVSKYAQVLDFAKANPLPKTAGGLADALMDMAAILIACQEGSRHWDSVDLCIIHHARASPHPGAFLSNPALLPSTVSTTATSKSFGSLSAGCLFSYPYYQDDSLGTVLLLTAFSPRTRKPRLPASLYAQALVLLMDRGLIDSAGLSGPHNLARAASGNLKVGDLLDSHFSMGLSKEHIAATSSLRTDLAVRAIELALTSDKADLFTDATRARLLALALGRYSLASPPADEAALKDPAPNRRRRI